MPGSDGVTFTTAESHYQRRPRTRSRYAASKADVSIKMLRHKCFPVLALLFGSLAGLGPAFAQSPVAAISARESALRQSGVRESLAGPLRATRLDSLRAAYRVARAPVTLLPVNGTLGAPGSSFGSPTAFGAAAWDAFAGIGFQGRTRFTSGGRRCRRGFSLD